ncbi:MAG: alpha-ketoglutarate-dependent dioxygenase AlkB [Pseudobdellovibrio sp.]
MSYPNKRNVNSKPQNHQNLNLIYKPQYITTQEKKDIIQYLESLHPIWEMRFSKSNPPPEGEPNRPLLRPVYWLGNWQFACLDYYHPPKGIHNRCVEAESYPPVLQKIVHKIEQMVHENFSEKDIPNGWHLNTCLINFYGDKIIHDESSDKIKKIDVARVGEHKDFEPGPVGSISFGEKALFQFVKSASKSQKSDVVLQQWLEDSSLQIFGGDKFKKQLFHRVQRVENKGVVFKNMKTTHFETRRINFTFRYVPNEHIKSFSELPENLQHDIKPYVTDLSMHSKFWKKQLN